MLIEITEGQDVTELLGIQKWDPPFSAQLGGQARGLFPTRVPKTDQERIQNLSKELAEWRSNPDTWEVTEKLDGTSATFYLDLDGDFHACSRNLDLSYNPDVTFWKIAAEYDLEARMAANNLQGLAIQGEIVGESIQSNPYKIKAQDFYVFDCYDVNRGEYLSPEARRKLTEDLGLKHVPVIARNFLMAWDSGLETRDCLAAILALAEGASQLNSQTEREGVVFKHNDNSQVSFKAISNKFLLKTKN